MTQRFALLLEYDGGAYAGWQLQAHAPSIQGALEQALSRVADGPVRTVVAGRTDAGVHARGQVVHFDTTAQRPTLAWVRGANSHLPADIRVLDAAPVQATFSARFSATERAYRYLIVERLAAPALERGRVTWVRRPLDVAAMQRAAQALVGEHDFSAFRAAGCQSRTPWRRVDAITVTREAPHVVLRVRGNAFLHHMVRNIAGVLMPIGHGERPEHWAAQVLASRDRRCGGVTAPAQGLYLDSVRYPADCGLPWQAASG